MHTVQNALRGQTSFGSASVPAWKKDICRHSQGRAAVVLWEGRCSVQPSVGGVTPGVPFQKRVRCQSSFLLWKSASRACQQDLPRLQRCRVQMPPLRWPGSRRGQSAAPGLQRQEGDRSVACSFYVSAGMGLWGTQNPCLQQRLLRPTTPGTPGSNMLLEIL